MNLSTNNNPSQLVPTPQPQTELDQMFSGLGLDNFMGGNETNQSSKTQVNGNANTSTGNSLTLQDKQRYVKQTSRSSEGSDCYINTFKYYVSCTDGKTSVGINRNLLFHCRPIQ